MALPLLIPIVMSSTGLYGAAKALKAAHDSHKAGKINSSAQDCFDRAIEKLDQNKKVTNILLAGYGKKKLEALDKQILPFIALFKQLKNVEIANSAELENLKIGKFSDVVVEDLQHSCRIAQGALLGFGAGAVGGGLTAFGAYGGTMMLASAGTEITISSLSGAAATNATLAWLGGGTLASGGMGVAGGTMVLGVMVAGPALLIFGSVLGAKASKMLSEAKSNLEQAETFELEVDGIYQKLVMIQNVTSTASGILSSLRGRLRRANESLQKIINEYGVDFLAYDNNSKGIVFRSVRYAQLVKAIIDTPILNEKGELSEDLSNNLSGINAVME